jgi:hypothetical protein
MVGFMGLGFLGAVSRDEAICHVAADASLSQYRTVSMRKRSPNRPGGGACGARRASDQDACAAAAHAAGASS